jgi:ABC-type branched-subunit amino acid transport system ATPase component
VIRLAAVSAWYGSARALFDIDIEVAPGECIALLGRNGAGKSTTLRSIMSAGVTTTGRVTLGETDISRWPTDRIARAGVSWVPEDRRIFAGLTVRENIEIAARSAPPDRRRSLDEVLTLMPGVAAVLGQDGRTLSGGQQQMVAVARALAAGPRVLLLDEPSEGLAPIIVDGLREVLHDLVAEAGISTVLAEQNLAFVTGLASRIYVLARGSVVFEGPIAAFAEAEEMQRRYLAVTAQDA